MSGGISEDLCHKKSEPVNREEIDMLGRALQEFISFYTEIKPREVIVCSVCPRKNSLTKDDADGGYCHLQRHGTPPRKGFCSGLVPPEGTKVADGSVHITGAFLTDLAEIAAAA